MRWGPPQPPGTRRLRARPRRGAAESPDRPRDPQRGGVDPPGAAWVRRVPRAVGCAPCAVRCVLCAVRCAPSADPRCEPRPQHRVGRSAVPVPAVSRAAARGVPVVGTRPPLPAVPGAPSLRAELPPLTGVPPGWWRPRGAPPVPPQEGAAPPPHPPPPRSPPPPPLQIESSCGRDSAGPSGKAAHSSPLNSSPRSGAGSREGPGPPAAPRSPPPPRSPIAAHGWASPPLSPRCPPALTLTPQPRLRLGTWGGCGVGADGMAPPRVDGGHNDSAPAAPPRAAGGHVAAPWGGVGADPGGGRSAELSFPHRAQRRRPAR